MNEMTLFFTGKFNQCYPITFTLNNVEFSSAEQFMMAEKALIFEDKKIYDYIMLEDDTAAQKALGRKIKGFDQAIWDSISEEVVYRGNYAKFTQNLELYYELIGTYGTELVYAAANDPIWGIGLSENDPRALIKSEWLGQNKLGIILTELRENLLAEKENKSV